MARASAGLLPYASTIQTLTFLITDIEGSTALLRRLGDDSYAQLLADHHRIIRNSLRSHDGVEQGTEGDSFFATFTSPSAGVAAAIEMQRALTDHEWPAGEQLRVRMGIHTGEAAIVSTGLVGLQVHKAARIAAASHGGQVVLSASTAELVRDSMPADLTIRDLGPHRLKDLGRAEELYQLVIEGLPSDFPALRSLSNPELRHNLPVQLSSFIGREAELRQVRALLNTSRLVTLTGPGGCGKTRLALQVAADLLDGSGGGVWFVDLAPLRDERFVEERVASALGVREEPGVDVADSVVAWISDRALLVLLDNCEHLVHMCAKLSDRLLRACPNLTILATSREALGVDGEHPYRIPSLGLPTGHGHRDAATVGGCEAVQLLVERARVHDPGFAVDDANAEAVATICERLDGIPLALELVAARMSVMTPADVERRLDDRFRLLAGSSRTALPRQQTLLASLDWSYDLLDPIQRSVLQRLSVFVGSFDLAAAEVVCAASDVEVYEVAELVEDLVDRSLLRAEPERATRRIRMSESVREYAARKLLDDAVGVLASVRERHASYYDAIASNLPPMANLQPMSHEDALAEEHHLALELGNVQAALEHSLGDIDDLDRSLRLTELFFRCAQGGGLGEFLKLIEPHASRLVRGDPWWCALVEYSLGTALWRCGRPDDGEAHLRNAKSVGVESENLHAVVLANDALVFLAFRREDYSRALALSDEGAALAEASGDADLVAWAEFARARFSELTGDSEGIDRLRRVAAYFLRRGMEHPYWHSIVMLATIELLVGDRTSAREHYEAALGSGAVRSDLEGVTYLNLSELCVLQGDVDTAVGHWLNGADIIERNHWGIYFPAVLIAGALCCSAAGQPLAAVRLHGAVGQAVENLGSEIEPFEAKLCSADLETLRTIMGEESFRREFASGQAMTFASATKLGREALRSK